MKILKILKQALGGPPQQSQQQSPEDPFASAMATPALSLEDAIDSLGDVEKMEELDFKVGERVVFHGIARFGDALKSYEGRTVMIKTIEHGKATFEGLDELPPIPVLYLRRVEDVDIDFGTW